MRAISRLNVDGRGGANGGLMAGEYRENRCRPALAVTCDGTVSSNCANGRLSSYDCAALGFECVENGLRCANECAAQAWRCDGDTLVVCTGAGELRLPCTTLGFSACQVGDHGAHCI